MNKCAPTKLKFHSLFTLKRGFWEYLVWKANKFEVPFK